MEESPLQQMLVNVQTAKPDEIVKQVEAMFFKITQMSPIPDVAAYQTIDFLEIGGIARDPRVQKVKDALVARMKDLERTPPSGEYGHNLEQRFQRVVGSLWGLK